MFDFHTHILPGIDDGSNSVEESISMLNELKLQGVSGIAATPHFYAERMSPDTFFEERSKAWNKLKSHLPDELPEIRLGAEVQYFEGINRYEYLNRFRLEGTKLLLLEMPCGTWSSRMITALEDINGREDITLLLAHIERYYRQQKKETWNHLLKSGILMQASTDFFTARGTRKLALKLLREGYIHLLGTDCHNNTTRRPDMDKAVAIIQKKKCTEFLQKAEKRERLILQEDNGCMKELKFNMEARGG